MRDQQHILICLVKFALEETPGTHLKLDMCLHPLSGAGNQLPFMSLKGVCPDAFTFIRLVTQFAWRTSVCIVSIGGCCSDSAQMLDSCVLLQPRLPMEIVCGYGWCDLDSA